jgi:hypothetical protein
MQEKAVANRFLLPLFERYLEKQAADREPGYVRSLRPGDHGYTIGLPRAEFSIFRSDGTRDETVCGESLDEVFKQAQGQGWAPYFLH